MVIFDNSFLYMNDSTFIVFYFFTQLIQSIFKKNCTSKERGGAIIIFESSGLTIFNTQINSSKSNFGALFYFQENYKIPIQIIGCKFFGSYGNANLIDSFNSYVRINDTIFQDNSNNIFGVSSTTLELNNITIKNHICYSSNQGCLISGNFLSLIVLNRINLNSLTSLSAGNIFLEQCSILIKFSDFNSFQTNKFMGSCMFLQTSNANVTFSNFQNFSVNCIYSTLNGNLMIDQSNFENKDFITNANPDYGDLVCSSCSSFSITNSNFSRGSGAMKGGAISIFSEKYFSTKNEIKIDNNKFSENLANLMGGAIYLYNVNASVVNNTFLKNMAKIGGAIYFNNDGKINI